MSTYGGPSNKEVGNHMDKTEAERYEEFVNTGVYPEMQKYLDHLSQNSSYLCNYPKPGYRTDKPSRVLSHNEFPPLTGKGGPADHSGLRILN